MEKVYVFVNEKKGEPVKAVYSLEKMVADIKEYVSEIPLAPMSECIRTLYRVYVNAVMVNGQEQTLFFGVVGGVTIPEPRSQSFRFVEDAKKADKEERIKQLAIFLVKDIATNGVIKYKVEKYEEYTTTEGNIYSTSDGYENEDGWVEGELIVETKYYEVKREQYLDMNKIGEMYYLRPESEKVKSIQK